MNPHTVALPAVRHELLALAEEDRRVRAELAADGTLFDGYHPRMELVHRRNAARLTTILDRIGWPGRSKVGADGAHAAWLVAQHAIGDPVLQRRALELLRPAAALGEATVLEVAMLEDRVRTCDGRPQRYGTQYDWDRDGVLSPLPVEDADHVDERRRAVGLGPLAEHTRHMREQAAAAGELPPPDWPARQAEMDEWFRSKGWRSATSSDRTTS